MSCDGRGGLYGPCRAELVCSTRGRPALCNLICCFCDGGSVSPSQLPKCAEASFHSLRTRPPPSAYQWAPSRDGAPHCPRGHRGLTPAQRPLRSGPWERPRRRNAEREGGLGCEGCGSQGRGGQLSWEFRNGGARWGDLVFCVVVFLLSPLRCCCRCFACAHACVCVCVNRAFSLFGAARRFGW